MLLGSVAYAYTSGQEAEIAQYKALGQGGLHNKTRLSRARKVNTAATTKSPYSGVNCQL